MTVTLNALGKADWTDYVDYWRDDDAEWIQERSILRYATAAARAGAGEFPTPTAGHVTYNQETDQLEHFTLSTPAKWIGVLASQHLRVTPKTSANDTDPAVLGHRGAGGAGLQFFPTVSGENKIALPSAFLDIGNGAVIAKATGVTVTGTTTLATTKIKTGARTVQLTTDAANLVSDSPITAPGASLASLALSGTLTGGVLNGTSGTIGGVSMASNAAAASSGFVSQQGYFFGSATQARIRQRDSTTPFALGAAGFDITDVAVTALGTDLIINPQIKVYNLNSVDFYSAAPGSLLGHAGPVVYTATAIVATNYPEGTIWVTP